MKRFLILIAVTLGLYGCSWLSVDPPATHEDIMYQMAQDTLGSITDLFAAIAMNPDGRESNFWWNSPFEYCCNPDGTPRYGGSFDTTRLTLEPDTLWVDYIVEILVPVWARAHWLIPIPYAEVDSFTSTVGYDQGPDRECFRIYWKEEHDRNMMDIIPIELAGEWDYIYAGIFSTLE